jgi:hypothetical protein
MLFSCQNELYFYEYLLNSVIVLDTRPGAALELKVSNINRNSRNSSSTRGAPPPPPPRGRQAFFTFFHKKARHLSTSLCATCAYLTSLVVNHTAADINTVMGRKLRAI